jgi:hypothetical protein
MVLEYLKHLCGTDTILGLVGGGKRKMYVKHLQEYLDQFTDGKKGTAVSNAKAYMEMEDGTLAEIRRMEVLESTIIGDSSVMVVLKADRSNKIVIKSPSFNKS